uniref:hypothetical protein n=1 Tax=uncultured Sphingomonas sp. TaxID=158754 RepID=UPI0035C9E616
MKFMMFTALAAAVATPALAQTAPATPDTAQPAPAADPAAAQPTTTPDANASMATPAVAPMAATGSYPMCSRTVTDQCTERSNAKGERLHSTPRPHRK